VPRPPFKFGAEDEILLDEIQRATFNYFWHAALPQSGMVPDRTSGTTVSVAGVGFQLSSLPIGAERGWTSRADAEKRALLILNTLAGNPDNRKAGLFYHFIDGSTAGQTQNAYEHAVSTIDSALLFAGIITASSYFGGRGEGGRRQAAGRCRLDVLCFSIGRTACGCAQPRAARSRIHRPFLGAPAISRSLREKELSLLITGSIPGMSTGSSRSLPRAPQCPSTASRRRCTTGSADSWARTTTAAPVVWFPFSGALFTSFFAHCWINYSALGPDHPMEHGASRRASVDWWENSRRLARMHRLKCQANPKKLRGFGDDAWGLTASDAPTGYAVPGLFPRPLTMKGSATGVDWADFKAVDDYGDGTLAPYGAGCTIMFDPAPCDVCPALLPKSAGSRRLAPCLGYSRRPTSGSFGFHDAFNLSKDWVAPDFVAIDQGPLLLAIENARTGLIWKLFRQHSAVAAGWTPGLVRE
jgi:hypothetical protein